jgi:mersacidin/lichenicidin family type 2 lantibiotic
MKFDIVRAWKDAAYRESLSAQEQALLPTSPAGELELSDAALEAVHGADGGQTILNSVSLAGSCLQSDLAPCITLNGNCFNTASGN